MPFDSWLLATQKRLGREDVTAEEIKETKRLLFAAAYEPSHDVSLDDIISRIVRDVRDAQHGV